MNVRALIYTLEDMMDEWIITEETEIRIKIPAPGSGNTFDPFYQSDFQIEIRGDLLSIEPKLEEL